MTRPWAARLWATLREWGQPVLFALVVTQFGASAVQVDGASMLPALRHGEWLAVEKAGGWVHRLGVGGYARGDIVVFKPPRGAEAAWSQMYRGMPLPWRYRPFLVKRVIGLPGDRVSLRGGVVRVNGRVLPEVARTFWAAYCLDTLGPQANGVAPGPAAAPQPEVTVPPGHYYLLGDNRSPGGSLDSRLFGPVPVGDIAGRALARVWPLQRPAQATPPCDGEPHPEDRVRLSGAAEFSPRWLLGGP